MTTEEKLNLLKTTPLDDNVLNQIAEDLNIDYNHPSKDFNFKPITSTEPSFSDKQNLIRMMAGLFTEGDEILDKVNCMKYTYNDKKEYKVSKFDKTIIPSGFTGEVINDEFIRRGEDGSGIVIPDKLYGTKVVSLSNHFRDVELKKYPKIENENLCIKASTFLNTALTEIPDLSKMNIYTYGSHYNYPQLCANVDLNLLVDAMFNVVKSSKNIDVQTQLNYVVKNFCNPLTVEYYKKTYDYSDNPNSLLAKHLAQQVFGLDAQKSQLSKQEIANIQKEINITKPVTDIKDKYIYYLSSYFSELSPYIKSIESIYNNKPNPKFQLNYKQQIFDSLKEEIGDFDIVSSQYIQTLNAKDIVSLSKSTPLIEKDEEITLYKIKTCDDFTFIYHPNNEQLYFGGNTIQDNSSRNLIPNPLVNNVEFTEVKGTQKEEMFSNIQQKTRQTIADTILETDMVALPTEINNTPQLSNIDIEESR